jgi:small-conductance mechanosensitive channel
LPASSSSAAAFGASSLDYKLIFFSLHPDYNRSMAALSRVLLALNRGFREHGIEFAYPTQTLYIQGADGAVETQIMRSAPDSA